MISDSLIYHITFEDISEFTNNTAIIINYLILINIGLFLYNNRILTFLDLKLHGFV